MQKISNENEQNKATKLSIQENLVNAGDKTTTSQSSLKDDEEDVQADGPSSGILPGYISRF